MNPLFGVLTDYKNKKIIFKAAAEKSCGFVFYIPCFSHKKRLFFKVS